MTAKLPLLALAALTSFAHGQTVVTPDIEAVDLFKNGLVVLRASFPVPEAGEYVWEDPPVAVHGTFWIEGEVPVETRGEWKKVREVIREESATGDLQKDLAGCEVVVITGDGRHQGTVGSLPDEPVERPTTHLRSPMNPWSSGVHGTSVPPVPAATTGSFLVLKTGEGKQVMINRSGIVRIETTGKFASQTRWVEKQVLRFQVGDGAATGREVRVSWLARGISWAPSYRIELGEDGKLVIEQGALVRNELLDLKGTEIGLISGFPNVSFGQVDSPLWPEATLAAFFSQLGQRAGGGSPVTSQMIMSNVASSSGSASATLPDLSESGAGSDDLHIETIGARDLARGGSLAMSVGREETGYERVVEWTVPDARDGRGRYTRRDPEDADDPWDAVRFRNPFDFPMTTAPAMILDGGRFRGQSRSDWVNPGQVNCLRVTKALSLRADYSEVEEEGQREIVWIAGNDYRRTKVKGTMKLRNSRATPVKMSIRTRFSGELLEADRDPEKRLRTEGVASVNPRRELVWDFGLGAGEETELHFRYSVLVDQ